MIPILTLPARPAKPRTSGMTLVIDTGAPTSWFIDIIESHHHLIDLVKFGWGTSYVSQNLASKLAALQKHDIEYFFGGTLFEVFYQQGQVDQYYQYCRNAGCAYVEISNGTVDLSPHDKAQFIRDFSSEFKVLSEVGFKDNDRSLRMHPALWIEYLKADLAAGAVKVITEARESGTGGVCRADGEVRYGLIEEILDADLPLERLVFEAPTKELQTYFLSRIGPNANLANIALNEVIALETLRVGLRSETVGQF